MLVVPSGPALPLGFHVRSGTVSRAHCTFTGASNEPRNVAGRNTGRADSAQHPSGRQELDPPTNPGLGSKPGGVGDGIQGSWSKPGGTGEGIQDLSSKPGATGEGIQDFGSKGAARPGTNEWDVIELFGGKLAIDIG